MQRLYDEVENTTPTLLQDSRQDVHSDCGTDSWLSARATSLTACAQGLRLPYFTTRTAQIHCSYMFGVKKTNKSPNSVNLLNSTMTTKSELTRLVRYIGSRHLSRCGFSGHVAEEVLVTIKKKTHRLVLYS